MWSDVMDVSISSLVVPTRVLQCSTERTSGQGSDFNPDTENIMYSCWRLLLYKKILHFYASVVCFLVKRVMWVSLQHTVINGIILKHHSSSVLIRCHENFFFPFLNASQLKIQIQSALFKPVALHVRTNFFFFLSSSQWLFTFMCLTGLTTVIVIFTMK